MTDQGRLEEEQRLKRALLGDAMMLFLYLRVLFEDAYRNDPRILEMLVAVEQGITTYPGLTTAINRGDSALRDKLNLLVAQGFLAQDRTTPARKGGFELSVAPIGSETIQTAADRFSDKFAEGRIERIRHLKEVLGNLRTELGVGEASTP